LARFTRVAPAGTRTSAALPALAIFVPSTINVAFSITRPSPTISRAPSNAVTACAAAGIANPARTPRTTIVTTAATFTRCIGTSIMKYALRGLVRAGYAQASDPSSRPPWIPAIARSAGHGARNHEVLDSRRACALERPCELVQGRAGRHDVVQHSDARSREIELAQERAAHVLRALLVGKFGLWRRVL